MPAAIPTGSTDSSTTLPQLLREVEDFTAAAGWDQAPQLFALVRTDQLLAAQPDLGSQLDKTSVLTPIAQEPLPVADLADALAEIVWPDTVAGCALVQEIVVLPPDAEAELNTDAALADTDRMRRIAAQHPDRREARLVAGVLRDGSVGCVLRLRGSDQRIDELIEHPDLAPNLVAALLDTLRD